MNWSVLLHLGAIVRSIRDAVAAFADVQIALDELRRFAATNPDVKADLVRLEGDVKRVVDAFNGVKGLLNL